MGFFKRKERAPAELYARQLAERLHDAGRTDQQIADAIGASRAQVTKIRNGQESGTLLRPRLLALAEGREIPAPVVRKPARRPLQTAPHTPAPRSAPRAVPHFGSLSSQDICEPVSIHGQHFGWVAPDGSVTKTPPGHLAPPEAAGAMIPAHRIHGQAHRAQSTPPSMALRKTYDAMRAAGLSDTQAQAALAPVREWAQAASRSGRPSPEPEPDFMPFMAQAEQELRTGNNAGVWTTRDVVERAQALARQTAAQQQVPRQAAPPPRQIAAPDGPGTPAWRTRALGQQALPIWMGADYAARAAVREYLQQQLDLTAHT